MVIHRKGQFNNSARAMPFHSVGNPESVYASYNFHVNTPDGSMFVFVLEDKDKKPCAVMIHIGKTGGSVGAWSDVVGRAITRALDHGATIEELIEDFSNVTTDKNTLNASNYICRSGPEGVAIALMQYRQVKGTELNEALGINGRRPSKMGRRF